MFKMKRLKESVMAKIIAWILCVVSVIGSVVLGIFVLLGIEEEMFYKTREELLGEAYESVNVYYSQKAVDNRGDSAYAEILRENCFKYGIIKGDSLKDIDFHDIQSYMETNMTEEELKAVDVDKLYLCGVVTGNGYSDWSGWGYLGENEPIRSGDMEQYMTQYRVEVSKGWSEWTSLYADRICYDEVKGILYYRAENKFYPVQNFSLWYDGRGRDAQVEYNYSYDFDAKGYRLNYKLDEAAEGGTGKEDRLTTSDETVEADVRIELEPETAEEDVRIEPEAAAEKIESVLEGSGNANGIVNLAGLNNTAFNYKNWGELLLDNVRRIDSAELTVINPGAYSRGVFIDEPGYYLNENYTLVVSGEVQAENYWIVSVVPDSVPANLINSKYNERGWMVNFYYDVVDMNVFQGLGIFLLLTVVSFVFLASAAGHRRSEEGIVLTLLDKIPVDLFSAVVFLFEFMMLAASILFANESETWKSAYVFLGVFGLMAIIMVVAGLGYILSLCVRIKAGKWWRNSICYWILNGIRKVFRDIFRNIGLLWKTGMVLGVVSFMEFFVLVETDRSFVVFCWFMEKLVLCAVIFVFIIQIYELQKASRHMADGDLSYKINTGRMFWECRKHGENLNKIGEGMSKAVDERMKSERFKTELITNVSHDIKTPLTSIINYVDLLSKEELHNEKAVEYLEVLDRQSSKLKKLIEDLVEASKASTGNLPVDARKMDAGVCLTQTVGEFEEKLSLAGLQLIVSKPEEPAYIMADGRHMWRVIDNLMNNICKYGQPGSRVYVNLEATEKTVNVTFRNISKYPLNISGGELMERFVRGDKSRNTEGHGLGLSIAQSLMRLMGGDMDIIVDGDLFKVILIFNRCEPDRKDTSGLEIDVNKAVDIDSGNPDLV